MKEPGSSAVTLARRTAQQEQCRGLDSLCCFGVEFGLCKLHEPGGTSGIFSVARP